MLSTIPCFKQRDKGLPFVFFEPLGGPSLYSAAQLNNFIHGLTFRIRSASSHNIVIDKILYPWRPLFDHTLRLTTVEEDHKVWLGVLFDVREVVVQAPVHRAETLACAVHGGQQSWSTKSWLLLVPSLPVFFTALGPTRTVLIVSSLGKRCSISSDITTWHRSVLSRSGPDDVNKKRLFGTQVRQPDVKGAGYGRADASSTSSHSQPGPGVQCIFLDFLAAPDEHQDTTTRSEAEVVSFNQGSNFLPAMKWSNDPFSDAISVKVLDGTGLQGQETLQRHFRFHLIGRWRKTPRSKRAGRTRINGPGSSMPNIPGI